MPINSLSHRELRVRVVAPARLHMGFLDLSGSLGRRFGSIGLAINEIATRVSLTPSDRLTAHGPSADRAVAAVNKFVSALGREFAVDVHVEEAIPGHIGLGSGTQLELAVGMALSRLFDLDLAVRDLAPIVERGARSGIGIAVFEQGGLVVDGGRGENTLIPPVITRLEFPADWRLILVLDERDSGLHGEDEIEAFRALPAFPAEEAAHLCHLLLMKGLPALVERDIRGFGDVIAELQRSIGDYFAPAQGGRFTSADVADALSFLESQGAVGIGQSSWGPTGFCLVENATQGGALVRAARREFAGQAGIQFLLATPRNQGAAVVFERVDASREKSFRV
ncbi:beta-ribofuranosylaminobenzene 5'-phosphate synthase family protein [Methylocaldum szegediense]|mgnify:CR=1 FL=1|uniref:Beta-ribofuranosylaminobenzene 5'-phosphate synthase n=1 Tax=Methylocaldum szegediense TaxID=73780 RepID=A0ABN8X508_9GAMM|nr:beta-ribofuranosylaminobenzene 5'-phosphate synthase family protein [Methylocaldum szegediense]CAI8873140.1 beta-ribofuranosylaminobenzene 5'-phosphate synthase [Methylocaldum szegediense]